jgi:signal transduction histidine kinase
MTINFAAHVPTSSKSTFEQAVRRDTSVDPNGYPNFRIRPLGERPAYHVLVYFEPFEPNRARFGLDIGFNRPGSLLAEERRDTGEFLSPGKPFPEDTDQLALRGAVYKRHFPLGNVEQRRRAFIGTVGMTFSFTKLVGEAVRPALLQTVHFRIHGVGRTKSPAETLAPPAAENLLIDSAALSAARGESRSRSGADVLRRVSQVEFGGQVLRIDFDGQLSSFSTGLEQAQPVFILGVGVLFSVLLYAMIRSLQRSRSRLEDAVQQRTRALRDVNRNLQAEMVVRNRLEREILFVGYEEMKQIGQELHDDLVQRMTAAAFLTESLALDLERTGHVAAAREAYKIEKLLSDAALQTRLLARGLFPVLSEAGGLVGALEQLAANARATYRIACRIVCNEPGSIGETGSPLDLGDRARPQFPDDDSASSEDIGVAFNFYRIAQEAISNAVRHGRASSVTITLSRGCGKLRMSIADNGVGIDEQKALRHAGLGLQIMRHRCKMLGLGFGIAAGPGGGTIVCIGHSGE